MIIDLTTRFKDNAICNKKEVTVVFHWTGGSAKSAIDWLDNRLNGKGTVGYNYIISGHKLYILADPKTHYMNHSGLGDKYDRDSISIAFCYTSYPTDEELKVAKNLLEDIKEWFTVKEYTHHAAINSKKVDFPADYWEHLKKDLGI